MYVHVLPPNAGLQQAIYEHVRAPRL